MDLDFDASFVGRPLSPVFVLMCPLGAVPWGGAAGGREFVGGITPRE